VEFRIGAGNSILEWLVAPAMGQVASVVPGSTFSLLDWRTGDVVRGLLDHAVDFGIIRRSALVQPLKFKPLGRLTYRLFVPKALLGRKGSVPESLPLAISIGGEFLKAFELAASKSKQVPKVVYRCTSFTQAAQLVRCEVAAAVLPDIASTSLEGVAEVLSLPWMTSITRDLGLAWHRRLTDIRPHSAAILDALEQSLTARFPSKT